MLLTTTKQSLEDNQKRWNGNIPELMSEEQQQSNMHCSFRGIEEGGGVSFPWWLAVAGKWLGKRRLKYVKR